MSTQVARIDPQDSPNISTFGSGEQFDVAVRMARALSESTVIPTAYQKNIPNVLVAMELANRIGASVLAVMQNCDVIKGRPSLRSTFLIATVNASGRFTPLRFRFQGDEGTEEWGCRCVATDRESGEECIGALITIALAKLEGWFGKNDSKWKTIPELMLMYRSAGWWTRVYAPELSLGMHTADEIEDFAQVQAGPSNGARSLNERLLTATEIPDDPPAVAPDPARIAAGQLYQHTLHRLRPDLNESAFERRIWLETILGEGRTDESDFTVAEFRAAIKALETGDGPQPEREPGEDDE